MKKIIGKTSIGKKDEQKEKHYIEGFLLKDKIIYKEKDIRMKVIRKENEIDIIRESDTYKIELFLENKQKRKGKYLLKEENMYIDIDVISKIIKNEKTEIEIEYEIYIGEERISENIWKLNYEVIK